MNFNKTIITMLLLFLCTGCAKQQPAADQLKPPTPAPTTADQSTVKVTPGMIEAAQVEETAVELRQANQKIETTGEVKPDENKVFHVNSLVGGRLTADMASLGDYVHANQKLALVENLEVMRISANYIHETHSKDLDIKQSETRLKLARSNKIRLEKLFNEHIAAEKDYLAAQTQFALEEANRDTAIKEKEHQREETKAMLSAYGVSIDDIKNEEPIRFSPVLSPRNGFIVKKNITIGDVITSTEPLYVVSDLSQVWLDITIFDRDLSAVKEGAPVTFTTDSIPDHKFSGRIDYLKPLAQDSRTFVARAVLQNPKLLLKPGMFGHVEISEVGGAKQPFVPAIAVQTVDGKQVVFVKKSSGTYECAPIKITQKLEDGYFVSGLTPGQRIVTKGSYYIKEQLTNSTNAGSNL